MFTTELESAINGLDQELKELLRKYSKALPSHDSIKIDIVVTYNDIVGTCFIVDSDNGSEEKRNDEADRKLLSLPTENDSETKPVFFMPHHLIH